MPTLQEDIQTQSDWIIKAFAADRFTLDYSIDSLIEIDRFFNENMQNGQPKPGGRLAKKGFGPILFSIGAYIGETIIKNVPGTIWITDDSNPEGESDVSLKLPDGTEIWPVQRVIKRFEQGSEEAIYPYGHILTQAFTNQPFNEAFWALRGETNESGEAKRPWWKFW